MKIPLDRGVILWYIIGIKIMSIEQKISITAMERCLKANSEKETTAIAIWANNQLSLVSLWQRTGVKPDKLEF